MVASLTCKLYYHIWSAMPKHIYTTFACNAYDITYHTMAGVRLVLHIHSHTSFSKLPIPLKGKPYI